jgi:hypothetical protein
VLVVSRHVAIDDPGADRHGRAIAVRAGQASDGRLR